MDELLDQTLSTWNGSPTRLSSRPPAINVAEYKAFLAGLQAAAGLGVRKLLVRTDSDLVVNHMRGDWRVKGHRVVPLYEQAVAICEVFAEVRFEHVRREQNRAADRLANEALNDD